MLRKLLLNKPGARPCWLAGWLQMRFLPTNFARAKKAEESQSTDITSISVSKSEEAFEDLMKAVSCV